MSKPENHFYEFDSFRLDAQKRLLLRQGEVLALTPKAFDTLLALVEMRGRVIEKDELMEAVWGETIVEESALSRNIYLLRKALGGNKEDHRFIVTVPGRGYRFVANVQELRDEPAEVIVATRTRTSVVLEEETEGQEDGELEKAGDREIERQRANSSRLPAVALSPHRPVALALILVVLAILLIGFAYWWQRPNPKSPISNLQSIAVLPFKPLVAESNDEVLQMGMADVLITRLSNLRQLIVRPISAVRKYNHLEQDPVAAGRALQVDAVLDGNLQRLADRIRITVRLVSTKDGATLWADKFDEKFTDLFAVEDKLSERLANTLALQLTGEEKQLLVKRYTENVEAYQAYLKGRYFWSKWTKESLLKALAAFEQALQLDPNYAPAHAGVADAHNLLGYLGFVPPREAFPKSEAAAREALRLDDKLGEAHLSLAKTKFFYDWDWPGFEREIQRALELSPNVADAHSMHGTYLMAMGKFDEALAERKRGLELDPLSPFFHVNVGWSYFYKHEYDQAIEWYKKALELDPHYRLAQEDLGTALLKKGDYAQGLTILLKLRAESGESQVNLDALRQVYTTAGKAGYWRKELELAEEGANQGKPPPHWRMARIYTELQDKEHAITALEKAYDERHSLLVFLRVVPLFDSLHGEAHFENLLRRIGLPR